MVSSRASDTRIARSLRFSKVLPEVLEGRMVSSRASDTRIARSLRFSKVLPEVLEGSGSSTTSRSSSPSTGLRDHVPTRSSSESRRMSGLLSRPRFQLIFEAADGKSLNFT
jgi:hypothetical protein